MSITNIDVNGNTITIDSGLFMQQSAIAHKILADIEELTLDFKDLVEGIADATGMEKKHVGKYFKAKYKAATKAPKIEGDLFEALDNISEG